MVRPRNPGLNLGSINDATPGRGQGTDRGEAPTRGCEHPGCAQAGDYPAPRSRHQLRQYRWFCLEHIKSYNTQWNYFDGMGDELLEEHRKADMTWRRPTWRPGQRFRGWHDSERQLLDEIGLTEFAPQFFQAHEGAHRGAHAGQTAGGGAGKSSGYAGGHNRAAADAATMAQLHGMTPPRHLRSALALFNLPYPFTAQQLKQRYRQLVKQYHPDVVAATAGDAKSNAKSNQVPHPPALGAGHAPVPIQHEEAMKNINAAHQRLKNHVQGSDG